MNKRFRLITAICLIAQAFTSFVLSFVYANRKKELSHAFLGLGILGGLGGAFLLYQDYKESKEAQLALDGEDDWFDDDADDGLFDENSADDINFTIAEEESEGEEDKTEGTEENPEDKTEE